MVICGASDVWTFRQGLGRVPTRLLLLFGGRGLSRRGDEGDHDRKRREPAHRNLHWNGADVGEPRRNVRGELQPRKDSRSSSDSMNFNRRYGPWKEDVRMPLARFR